MRHGLGIVLTLALIGCGSSDADSTSPGQPPPGPPPADTPAPQPEPGADEEATPEGAVPEIERPYDETADAEADIAAAVAQARTEGKTVLLMFGANWCEWCRRLDYVFQNEPRVSGALEQGWVLVHVDVGARGSSTNRELTERYGDPAQYGLPCLVVLDEAGDVEHVQETGSLEDGPRHDPARLLAFLAEHRRES